MNEQKIFILLKIMNSLPKNYKTHLLLEGGSANKIHFVSFLSIIFPYSLHLILFFSYLLIFAMNISN
jgi:hypothetical protein